MTPSEVFWHDLEHAGYVADLPIWLEIASAEQQMVVELGCGTGRVACFLAANGVSVIGIDNNGELLAALLARTAPGCHIKAEETDLLGEWKPPAAASFVAPAMFFQTIGSSAVRSELLSRIHRALDPEGLLAISVVDDLKPYSPVDLERLPSESVMLKGVLYESRAVAMQAAGDQIHLVRERRVDRQLASVTTQSLTPWSIDEAIEEAAASGLTLERMVPVRGTGRHGAMTILVFHAT